MTLVTLIYSSSYLTPHRMNSFSFPLLHSFLLRQIECVLLLIFLSSFLDLLEEENWRFLFEVNLLFFVLLLLHGSFAQIAKLQFVQRFRMIFAHYVSIVGNFEIIGHQFLYCFTFKLLLNYFLFLFPFQNFICNKYKLVLNYLNFTYFKI